MQRFYRKDEVREVREEVREGKLGMKRGGEGEQEEKIKMEEVSK